MSEFERNFQGDQLRRRDLERIIHDKSVIFDVGGHVGEFAQTIRDFSNCMIYSFEPAPDSFRILSSSIQDANFRAFNLAISTESGERDFHLTESRVGSSFLQPVTGQNSKWLTLVETIKVSSQRIDSILAENNLNFIDLLKSDAEGYDLKVLESAGAFLNPQNIGAVLVELSFHEFHKGQDKYYDVMKILSDSGYFLAGLYPHFNHKRWLWWADALFLPNSSQYSTNVSGGYDGN